MTQSAQAFSHTISSVWSHRAKGVLLTCWWMHGWSAVSMVWVTRSIEPSSDELSMKTFAYLHRRASSCWHCSFVRVDWSRSTMASSSSSCAMPISWTLTLWILWCIRLLVQGRHKQSLLLIIAWPAQHWVTGMLSPTLVLYSSVWAQGIILHKQSHTVVSIWFHCLFSHGQSLHSK